MMTMKTPPRPRRGVRAVARQPVGTPEWTLVTPELAYDILAEHNPRNRNINPRKVAQYAADMTAGRWDEDNGSTIGLDADGDLVDGQHRLTAVVEADQAIHFWIMRGLERVAQDTLDIGQRRELGAQLSLEGMKDARIIAAAGRMVFAYERIGIPVPRMLALAPTDPQVRETINRHPGLHDSANDVSKVFGLTRSTSVGLHYLFTYVDVDDATYFFQKLGSGAGLEPNDPILVLRERLIREKQMAGGRKMDTKVITAFVIRTFNAYRRGERLHKLQWSDGQVFPRIEGITLSVLGDDETGEA